jgi:zinc transporter 9
MAGSGTKVVVSAIAGNSFITVIKFIGWVFSQSPSLLAEAIHSLADTSNQILLLIGLKKSGESSTREHPTGTGGARYLWNLISAVGIFFIGFGVTFYHGIHSLMSGHYEVGPISYIGVGVLTISLIVEAYVLKQAYVEVKLQKGKQTFLNFFKESDDPTLVAVLLEDGVAVLGVLFALSGIFLGQIFQSALFDIFASIGIALLLGFMAIALAFINSKLLIGKSLSVHKEDEVKSFIEGLSEVKYIERLSTKITGAGQVRLSIEIELNPQEVMDFISLEDDAKKIISGEPAQKILLKSNQRMLRLAGRVINNLELKIQGEFPEITLIDFELN